jgi:hypothetical protein
MTIEMNLDEVEAWSGSGPPPPGTHVARIDSAAEGESSGGYPQIELDLRVTAGDANGATIRDWLVAIPSTYGKVKQLLEAAGVEIPQGAFALDVSVLEGRPVQIVVRENEYLGEKRMRVMAYEPVNGAVSNPTPAGVAVGDDDIPF